MMDEACPVAQEPGFNPLLFVVFCPHCVASGLFALAAAGFVSMPALFGVPFEYYLAPAIVLGSFFTWLAWGAWQKRCRPEGEPQGHEAMAGST